MLVDPVFVEENVIGDTPAWPYQFRALHFDPYDLRDWCIENLTARGWYIHDGRNRNERGITFNSAEDAMAFKLTWV